MDLKRPNDLPYPKGYKPTNWVKEVVGQIYRGPAPTWGEDKICEFRCIGYNPDNGFWFENLSDPTDLRNTSERAINRTYHPKREY
jgi:hypothetical protein